MTSPKSGASKDNVLGLFLLLVISLAIIVPIVIMASGMSITPPVQASPSHPTLQAQVDALQTQVSKLSSENATLQTAATAQVPTATPSPAAPTLIVITGAANVRTGPSTDYAVIDTVQKDQVLKGPFSTQNGWHKICCVKGDQQGWIAGNLVQTQSPSHAAAGASSAQPNPTRTARPTNTRTAIPTARPTNTRTVAKIEPGPNKVTSPPESLSLSHIYKKYLSAQGAHIVAPNKVSNRAMLRARDILFDMVSTRPDLLAAMTRKGLRIIIYDDSTSLQRLPEFVLWPLASQRTGGFKLDSSGYTIAAPEAKLRCSPTLIHEIAHAIDYAERSLNRQFSIRLDRAYRNAMAAGLWKGKYAATDKHEYWAVAVQTWFRPRASDINLSRYDPEATTLVKSVFGNAKVPAPFCF